MEGSLSLLVLMIDVDTILRNDAGQREITSETDLVENVVACTRHCSESSAVLLVTLTVPAVGVRPVAQETSDGLQVTEADSQEERCPPLAVSDLHISSSLQKLRQTPKSLGSGLSYREVEGGPARAITTVQLCVVFNEQSEELDVSGSGGYVDTRLALAVGHIHKISLFK